MTEEQKTEVEIKDMLDNMIAQNGDDVKNNFNDLMSQRVNDSLDQARVEKAQDIFRQSLSPDGASPEEFDKMGLTPNEEPVGEIPEPVDVNLDTGVPVDKEKETNENV
jgi:hypothetical protein